MPKEKQMQRRVLTFRDLKPRKGIPYTRPTINKMVDRDDFPAPFALSERVTVWFEDEIDAWLEAKKGGAAAA